MLYEFSFPYEVPSQNLTNSQHWSKRAKENKRCWLLIAHYSRYVPLAKGFRKVKITAYRKRRITDVANFIGGAKGLVDQLVRNKLLIDDSDVHCMIEYEQKLISQLPEFLERFQGLPVTTISLEDK